MRWTTCSARTRRNSTVLKIPCRDGQVLGRCAELRDCRVGAERCAWGDSGHWDINMFEVLHTMSVVDRYSPSSLQFPPPFDKQSQNRITVINLIQISIYIAPFLSQPPSEVCWLQVVTWSPTCHLSIQRTQHILWLLGHQDVDGDECRSVAAWSNLLQNSKAAI
jgi:hypothetical protein